MKPSSKDAVAGKIHEVKGTVKEKVGKLTKNPDLEAEGTVQEGVGVTGVAYPRELGRAEDVLQYRHGGLRRSEGRENEAPTRYPCGGNVAPP